MRTADWTESVSVLDRVTAVFEAFGEQDEGLGVSELARRANLPKSTVSRIAADLVAQRFLDRDGDKLYLGVRLFELGQTVEQPRRLRRLALPVMTELRDSTGQTVHPRGARGRRRRLHRDRPRRGRSETARAGSAAGCPPTRRRSERRILAFAPPRDGRRASPAAGLVRRTPHTICEPSALLRELAEIRRIGIAAEREECATGRVCVATPDPRSRRRCPSPRSR